MTTLHLVSRDDDLARALAIAAPDDIVIALPTVSEKAVSGDEAHTGNVLRIAHGHDRSSTDDALSWMELTSLCLEHDRVLSW